MRADGQWIKRRYEELVSRRLSREMWWEYARRVLVPQKFDPMNRNVSDGSKERSLFDQTAIDCTEILANGHSSHVTPSGQRWFLLTAPEETARYPEVKRFYAFASERMWKFLAKTNFYTESRATYLERSAFGIGTKMCLESASNVMFFRNIECGSYVIAENSEGEVDTFIQYEEWSIRVIAEKLGEKAMSKKMAEAWKKYQEKGTEQCFPILWAVYYREEHDPTKFDHFSRPVASVHVDYAEQKVLKEEGYMEFPGSISRFLKGGGEGKEYGYGPLWRALPSIKGANFIQMVTDYAAEKQLVPALLIPEYLKGMVDSRAGGITYFKTGKGQENLPQTWQDRGRFDIGLERIEARQKEIRAAFYTDQFQMLAGIDREMTAYEVQQRLGEKLDQFTPTFLQQMYDDRLIMRRIFGIMLRRGLFGRVGVEIPQRALVQVGGVWTLPDPELTYNSRLAQALTAAENSTIERQITRAQAVSETNPQVWDIFDMDAAFRLMGENDGVPEGIYKPVEQVAEIREARAAAQEQQQTLEGAEMAASAAGKVGLKVSA